MKWVTLRTESFKMFVRLFVLIVGLCFGSEEKDPSPLGIPLLYGPSEALVKDAVNFGCELMNYPQNETIHLQVYKVGHHERLLGEYTYQPGQLGVIPMVITESHEGFLECVAKPLNATSSDIKATVSAPHYLKVIVPVKNAEIEYSGPLEFSEGNKLELHCRLAAGNHVSYSWLFNGRFVVPSPSLHVSANRLTIFRTTPGDGGFYRCIASNTFNNTLVFTSHSPELEITVKASESVSDPDVSFTLSKEKNNDLSALVSCRAENGTPPITFDLYNRTALLSSVTVGVRRVTFKVPLVTGEHRDWLQCRANNSDQIAHGQWLPLRVVPVTGPVTMSYDRDVGENYAVIGLRFYCKAAGGSHPRYSWFLNKTLLRHRGSFHYVVDQPPEQSVLLLSVGKSSAGTYHCEVSDSFDNATTVSSNRKYIDEEALNRLPTLVVAVVFGSFTAIVILVSVCCCVGVMYRRRTYGEKSLLTLEMERIAAYEGEMESSAYVEDGGVVEITSEDNFDQVSEASAEFP